MFSSSLKRSVATLGVLAGLLAAAGPASAQIGPGTMGVNVVHNAGPSPIALMSDGRDLAHTHDTQTSRTNSLAVGVRENGSQGMWAPAHAEQSSVWHEAARNGVVTDNKDPEGTQVGSEGVTAIMLGEGLVEQSEVVKAPGTGAGTDSFIFDLSL